MNENTKTIVFAAVALGALLLGLMTRPSHTGDPVEELGGDLFKSFKALDATEIQVVRFDEATGESSTFEVKQQPGGAWVIPSHDQYPADGQQQMENAASALVGLEKGPVVTDNPAEHGTYGVRDPSKAKESETGVGTLVRLADAEGKTLVELIVGESVEGSSGVRFVRKPAEDRVYRCKVDISNLSTHFEDWIQRDFMDLDAANVAQVALDNYTVEEKRFSDPLGRVLVSYEPKRTEKLVLDHIASPTADQQKWTLAGGFPEDKLLDEDKLDALKSAMDDLRIIDVKAKDPIVAKFFKDGKDSFAIEEVVDPQTNQLSAAFEQARSLMMGKGFFFYPTEDQKTLQVLSNQGQIFVDMKDGVRYVLRFGEITGGVTEAKDGEAAKGSNRHILVLAQVNEAAIEKPKLQELPKLPEGIQEPAEAGAKDEASKDANTPAKAQDEKTTKLLEERKQIRQANEAAQKAYKEKIEAAQKRVAELNRKFGPWYYIISDDIFKKIRLERPDILKPNAAFTNERDGKKFLEENKKKQGVVETSSGLQYQVIQEGSGKKPTPESQVQVRYKGTLLDGTVFDQTQDQATSTFGVTGVIKGWTEGLQLMKEGAKYKFFIPSDIAYGKDGSGEKIGPNAVLTFEIELVKVIEKTEPPSE